MRTTPLPNIEAMVAGGESRLRRRTSMRLGIAAAVLLLVGGGIYGATQIGDDDPESVVTNQPTDPTEVPIPQNWENNDFAPVEAGTYRTFVGRTDVGGAIEADYTIDGEGWHGANYPVAFAPAGFAGVGVYQPESVAGGCQNTKEAATTPDQLVQQLLRMPRSEVVQQPARSEAFGGSAIHLQLRIDAVCSGDDVFYHVGDGPGGASQGISWHSDAQVDAGMVIIDFWVVDVDGTLVLVDRFHLEGALDELVAQSTRAVESITFIE